MRKLPEIDGEVVAPNGKLEVDLSQDASGATIIRQQRKYELITPLFGGGVEPKRNDLEQLLNGKSIRGHLRFWWRASRGTGTLAQMKLNESNLWGAASTPTNPAESKVSLEVHVNQSGNPDYPFIMDRNRPRPNDRDSIVPPYAGFSLQPTDEEIRESQRHGPTVPVASVQSGIEFTLKICFPSDVRDDVESTLWCWETFGGVGGRTRRGFGAIALQSVKQDGADVTPEKLKTRDVLKNINEKLKTILAPGEWDARIPHLPRVTTGVLKVTNAKYAGQRRTVAAGRNNVLKSWWYLIDRLHQFRQSPRDETNYKGRSDWPEPDEIRRKYTTRTGMATARAPAHKVAKFPRAEFGLPIVFKFKDDDKGDPPKTTLEGSQHGRTASPLILRPLLCGDGSVSIALILETQRTPPDGISLKDYGTVVTDLSAGDEIHIRPLRGKSAKTDVLRAFLESL